MDNSTLAGFIIVGLLIVIMGGMTFYFLTSQDTDSNVPPLPGENESVQDNKNREDSNKVTWHKVATFSGSTDDYQSVYIRGNKFKVTMSAVPM